MDIFEKKYGFKEDGKVIAFHKNRRMFCIYDGKLVIAESGLPYSHATWFEKNGWLSESNDELMSEITRGIIDEKGDLYFYVGYDFQTSEKAELEFFAHLKELTERLNLKLNAKIFGGAVKKEHGEMWPSRKIYGKVADFIK